MLDLTSDSTLAEVDAAYKNNADYDLSGSVEMAKNFAQACRYLIRMVPVEVRSGGDSSREPEGVYERALKEALAWLGSNDPNHKTSTPGDVVRYSSFRENRE